MINNKKAISPLIATVLLVGISVAAASMIYIWMQGFIGEGTIKNGAPIERSCDQLSYTAEISSDQTLLINNQGNIPIKEFLVKATNADGQIITYEKNPARDSESHIPAIYAGTVVKLMISEIYNSGVSSIEVIPVLYGKGTSSGQPKIAYCPNQKQEVQLPL
jgi:hypothetical protein